MAHGKLIYKKLSALSKLQHYAKTPTLLAGSDYKTWGGGEKKFSRKVKGAIPIVAKWWGKLEVEVEDGREISTVKDRLWRELRATL